MPWVLSNHMSSHFLSMLMVRMMMLSMFVMMLGSFLSFGIGIGIFSHANKKDMII